LTVRKRGTKYLGILTVLAVMFAMLVPTAANAAPPTGLSLTPENDSIPAGYCNAFTVTLTGATQTDITGQTIDVVVMDADTGETVDSRTPVRFCTPDSTATANNYNQSGPNIQTVDYDENDSFNFDDGCEFWSSEPAGCDGDISGEVGTTNSSGQITFGIISNDSGTYQVTAWYDTDDSESIDTGEPSDVSGKTFTQPVFIPQCSDQADNDGDGAIDFGADPGCTSNSDNDETDPAGPGANQCEDGFDNDGDGLIDFGSDGGCKSRTDNDETGSGNRRLATSVTIRYNRPVHAFKGTLSNSARRCRVNRRVVLMRKRQGPDAAIRRGRTTDKGTYLLKKRRVRGKTWYVKARPKQFPNPNGGTTFCLKGRSVNLTIPRKG